MKINFIYNQDKDIDCLLSKGPGSTNQPGSMTKPYESLLLFTSDINNKENVREFVRKYIRENNIDIEKNKNEIENNWNLISGEFNRRAEEIFGIIIEDEVNAYLTITGRHPYNVGNKYFYVSAEKKNVNKNIMHELWHFYTWYRFGDFNKVDPVRYNDAKESLTAILNIVFRDLMDGGYDKGYSQHQNLRNIAIDTWDKTKDIGVVWNELIV